MGIAVKRTMQHSQHRRSVDQWYRLREKSRILVVVVVEDNPVLCFDVRLKADQSQALPFEQILGNRECDARAFRSPRNVAHDVQAKRFDERNARVFATAASLLRAQFVRFFRFKGVSQALHPGRISPVVKKDAGDSYPRVIVLANQTRKEVELAVRPASRTGIEHTLDLILSRRIRAHDDAEALYFKGRFIHLIHVDRRLLKSLYA